MIGLSDP
ncbi:hypothetical protein YPPY98_3024, partial [Yersinia pestis PY-98]